MGAKFEDLTRENLGEDAEIVDIPLKEPRICNHVFSQRTSREIVCAHCNAGYEIGVGDRIVNGHLYHGDKLVI